MQINYSLVILNLELLIILAYLKKLRIAYYKIYLFKILKI